MTPLSATREIHASPHDIARIVLNIAELADWNPALNWTDTGETEARVGHPYRVSTRLPGRATLTYQEASPNRIVWRLDVAGNAETGEWTLEPHGAATRVTHTMTHRGPFFALARRAMMQVPTWRLDRLQERAERSERAARP